MVKIAAIQMCTGLSLEDNLADSAARIKAAALAGAKYVQTPEMTPFFAKNINNLMDNIAPWDKNPVVQFYASLAKDLGITLHIGSLAIQTAPKRAANRSVVFEADGAVLTTYDKIHMFDVDIAGDRPYRESNTFDGGDRAALINLPFGRLGLSICYDIRFSVLYDHLARAGVQIIAVPAAFTAKTGQAHWEVLLRSRAIETGCFVIASAQSGIHENGRHTHGHSMIIDPWGKILAEADDGQDFIIADIDIAMVDTVRQSLPNLSNQKDFKPAANKRT